MLVVYDVVILNLNVPNWAQWRNIQFLVSTTMVEWMIGVIVEAIQHIMPSTDERVMRCWKIYNLRLL